VGAGVPHGAGEGFGTSWGGGDRDNDRFVAFPSAEAGCAPNCRVGGMIPCARSPARVAARPTASKTGAMAPHPRGPFALVAGAGVVVLFSRVAMFL